LGTIAVDELKQAVWEDFEALKDQFGVHYLTGVRLTVPATNEYGDPMQVRRLSTGTCSSGRGGRRRLIRRLGTGAGAESRKQNPMPAPDERSAA
jgi:hypothetical protein